MPDYPIFVLVDVIANAIVWCSQPLVALTVSSLLPYQVLLLLSYLSLLYLPILPILP
jgi:hypothetical protein